SQPPGTDASPWTTSSMLCRRGVYPPSIGRSTQFHDQPLEQDLRVAAGGLDRLVGSKDRVDRRLEALTRHLLGDPSQLSQQKEGLRAAIERERQLAERLRRFVLLDRIRDPEVGGLRRGRHDLLHVVR